MNKTVLPYWIETGTNGCNTTSTNVWVKVPNISTAGTTLYLYYGNSGATDQQNANNVFLFFDGFNNAPIDSAKWTLSAGATASITSGELLIQTGSVYSNTSILPSVRNVAFEMRSKVAASQTEYTGITISNTDSLAGNNANSNKVAVLVSNRTVNINQMAFAASGTSATYDIANNTFQFTPTANTYFTSGFSFDATHLRYFQNRIPTSGYVTNVDYAPYLFLGYPWGSGSAATNGTDITIDFVLARKSTTVEPSATLSTEESMVQDIWYWWNGSNWVSSNGDYTESNTAAEINANISTFPSVVGTGKLNFKAFLHADNSTQQVELSSVNINYFSSTAPTISSLSSTSGTTAGEVDVTITGTNFSSGAESKIYNYTGSDQTYTVPAGVTSIRVKMWGAGGGGGNKGGWTWGYEGGGGGYTTANIAVTPGQVLTVMVGAGGNRGTLGSNSANYGGGGPNCGGTDCQYGGQGGGRSAIRVGGEDILTAGGGGGGGSTNGVISNNNGGGGGGLTGQDGKAAAGIAMAGKGATQYNGGAAGSGANQGATAGTKYMGGRPVAPWSYGGSGGGGWYGGGGGAYTANNMGGGGGGSSYIGGAGITNATTIAADGVTQANAGDLDNGGAGLGGAPNVNGQPGKVVIDVLPRAVTFGGVPARNIRVVNSTTIIATIPSRPAGTVNVTVTNPDGQTATLENAYTYNGPTASSLSTLTGPSIGGTDVTITGLNFQQGLETKVYNYTGSDQTYTVPAGVTSIRVKMWGAGGGGGNKGGWTWGYQGGGGGYTTADIAVTPGQVLQVMVGQGGNSGSTATANFTYGGGGATCGGTDCQYGGQGGGRSAIRLNSEDLVTAGGGGGGGSTNGNIMDQSGGGGGGATAEDGTSQANSAYAGKGGTQSAGGVAGSGTNQGASAGLKYQGGRPNSPWSYGGSGGGGYWGGGAGAYSGTYMGGGGGGSSYVGGPGVSNGVMVGAKGRLQANPLDFYNGGAGAGGIPNTNGQHGKVVIEAMPISVKFGNVSATNIRFINSTTIIATSPAQAEGTVNVTVTNPDGYTSILSNAFTYTKHTITSITPNTGSTAGGTEITISGSNFKRGEIVNTFNFIGADQTYVVPDGVTSIKVKMWGAGGGGGAPGGWGITYPGGGGGYTYAEMPVTPGQVLKVMVGAGGTHGNAALSYENYGGGGANCVSTASNCIYGGQGGGRSAIRFNGEDLLTAGGGGGGGSSRSSVLKNSGGAGGGLIGQFGLAEDFPSASGKGGSQGAGGLGGSGGSQNGTAGSKYTGGRSAQFNYGGSGGGGWYGGGGGSYREPNTMAGGGGGSSYIGTPGLINPIALRGNYNLQANSTDYENGGAGAGGGGSTVGQPGKVIIIANPLKVTVGGIEATEVKYIDSNTITAKVPSNPAGAVDIVVSNANGESVTIPGGFTYQSATLSSVNPTTGSTNGGTTITISGTNFAAPQTTVYEYTGGDQTYTVPAGINSIRVKMWGAGGGGGDKGGWTYGYAGGGGGYTAADLNVTPGQNLTVMVGQGGLGGSFPNGSVNYGGGGASCVGSDCAYAGSGGGRSAIRVGGEDILTAGGGGGGGSTYNYSSNQIGGAGGGSKGQDGTSNIAMTRGLGGTQLAGGLGGVGSNTIGRAGTKYTGGSPNTHSYGGAGGGGWYGGGGGAYSNDNTMGGGGGGSSYIGGAGVVNGKTLTGNGTTQANSTDPENGSAGEGGSASRTGKSGKVIITSNPIKVEVGGILATDVTYVNETTITATIPIHSAGVKDIKVTNPDGSIATLTNSFTYTGATLSSISPTSGSASGGTNITINGANIINGLSSTTFEYVAKDQTYVVPAGVTSLFVEMWGGGGGGGAPGGWNYGFPGGGGGYTSSQIPVTPGQEITVMVGAGGMRGGAAPTNNLYGGGGNHCNGNCVHAGQGGGRSAIRIGGEDILTAGAGGGGGSSRSATLRQNGGAGGGLIAQNGLSEEVVNAAGKGGTQTAGGLKGFAGGGARTGNGFDGAKYQGGTVFNSYGGSGGGGWYGGGGGAYQESNTMGGGGGGSSYIGTPYLINPVALRGNLNVQANSTDSDNGGAGAGGAPSTNGTPGKVIITAAPSTVLIGNSVATNVQWVDSNTLTATTTSNTPGVKDVSLVTPDGQTVTLNNSFTVIAPPTLNSINPNRVSVNGGTLVTINGSGFQATPSVKFDGIDATSVIFVDSNTIQAVVPAHVLGPVEVKVINPDGLEGSLADGVIYSEPAPTISSINPIAGPTAGGNSVTITGQNFLRKGSFKYVTNGLVGYWPMNNDSSTSIADQSGNSFNGTSVSSSLVNGYVSNGRQFGGAGYVTVPHNTALNPTSAVTMMAWIRPTNFADFRVIAGKLPWTSNYSYQMSTTPTGKFRIDISSNGTTYSQITSQTSLTAGQWQHVAFSWDGSTVRMYINGVEDANTLSFTGPIFSNSNAFEIGRPSGGSPSNQQYFNGTIDEVMLYNKALSLGEIQQNYNAANAITFRDGFYSHLKLDETSGQNVNNSIPFGPTGFMGFDNNVGSDDPTRLTGNDCKFGSCLSFDGTGKYVNIPSNFNQSTTLSFSLWFKTTSPGGILGQANSYPSTATPTSWVPVLWIMPDGKLRAELYTATDAYLTTTNAVNDGQWHHVVITGNSTTQSLYVDNVLIGSRGGTIQWSWWNYTSLGAAHNNPERGAPAKAWSYFNGSIDDFRVFNRFLNASDVDVIYNNNYPQVANYIDVYFGNKIANNINFVDSSTITMNAPEGDGGLVDVKVESGDGQIATATGGYRYIYDRFAIVSPPVSVRATEPATFVVQAQDINGNPIVLDSPITLNLSSTSTSGFFAIDLNEDESTRWDYNSITIPAGASSATFYYKDNQKGTPTITAATNNVGSLPATQVATIKSKFQLLITGVTSPIKLGVPSSVTVVTVDYQGTPQHDYQGTINFSSDDPATILPSDFTFDLSMLGEHTFVNGVTMVTQGEFCVTATDVNDPDITGSQCNIVVDPPDIGTIAQLKILNGAQTIPLDGKTTEITVQTQDTDGTGIPVQSITPLYFYSTSSTGQFSLDGINWFSRPFEAQIPAYSTSRNFFYRDTTLGSHTITIRDDSVPNLDGTGTNVGWENDQATITVAVGSAAKLALTGIPTNLTAGSVSTPISISMQDIEGNNLTATQDKTVYLSSNSNDLLYSVDGINNFSTTLATKIKTGDLNTVVYVKSNKAGSVNLTVSDANPADGNTGLIDDTKSLNISASTPNKLVITNAPSEVTAGEASQAFTVQVQDAYSNPVNVQSNFPVYLTTSNTDGIFSATSFGATITSISIPSGSNSVNFYFKQNKYFSTQTVYASDTSGGFGAAGITDAQTVVTINTGSIAQLGFLEASPYNATAGIAAGTFTAVVKNTFGVEIPTPSDLQLYLYTDSTATTKEFSLLNNPWTPITSHTLTTGSSRFTFYYKDTKSGTTTIKVSDDDNATFEFGLTNATISLNIAAAAPSSVKFSTNSQTIDAGVVSSVMTATLYDQYNNVAKSVGSTTVNLATSSGTGRFDRQSNGAFNGSITTVIISNNQSSANFYYKDTNIGTPLITLSATNLTGDSQSQTIVYGNVTRYDLTVASTSIVAGVSSQAITLRTYNAGNVNIPVPSNFNVNLTSSRVATGRFDTSSEGQFNGSVTSITVLAGENSAVFYYKDTLVGTATVSATKTSYTTATRNFTITANVASKIVFKFATLPDLSIGQKSAGIYAQTQDQYGNVTNVTSNTTVYLHSTSSNHEFTNASNSLINSITIASGTNEAQFFYKDFNVGTPTITLSDIVYPDSPDQGLTNDSKSINIVYGTPTKLRLTAANPELQAGVAGQVTLTLLNAYDQEVPAITNTVVNLQSTSGTGGFDTNVNGSYNLTSVTVLNGSSNTPFYYKDTTSGSPTISAIRTGFTTGTLTFNLLASNVFRLVFNSAPQTITAGTSSGEFIIKFRDQYGNYTSATAPFTVNLASQEVTGQFATTNTGPWNISSVSVLSGASDARFYYQDTVAGTKTLTVSADTLLSDTQNIIVNASTPVSMQFVPNTSQTIPGQIASAPLNVVLFDQYSNIAKAASPITLDLITTSSNAQFAANSTPWVPITSTIINTNSTQTTFYYKDWIIGNPTITVSDNSNVLEDITLDFTIIASQAAKLLFETDPKTTFTNTPSSNITIFVADENGYETQFAADSQINVSTNSNGGQFSVDNGQTWTPSLTLNIESSTDTSRNFLYVDTAEGTPTITITSAGLTSATQQQTIVLSEINKIQITGDSTIEAGVPISLSITTINDEDELVGVSDNTVLTLDSTSITGEFSMSDTNWVPITEVTLNKWQNQKTIYYKDTSAGAATITIDELVDQGWAAGIKLVNTDASTYFKIIFLQKPASIAVNQVSTQFVIQTVDQYGNLVGEGQRNIYVHTPNSGLISLDGTTNFVSSPLLISLSDNVYSGAFYYKDSLPGNKTITASDSITLDNPDSGIVNAFATVNILGDSASGIRITSTAYTQVTAGQYTGAITIEAYKEDNTAAILGSALDINLSTLEESIGKFKLTPDNQASEVTVATIPIGSSTTAVYFTSNIADTHVMQFESNGITGTSQNVEFKAAAAHHFRFLTVTQTVGAGIESAQFRVILEDEFNNAAIYNTDLTINLSSTSTTGKFSVLNNEQWADITQLVLSSGNSDNYFYYKDTVAGTYQLTVDETPNLNITAASQQFIVTAGSAALINFLTLANTLEVNQSSNLMTVSLYDVLGNNTVASSDLTVYLYSSSNAGTFSTTNTFVSTITSILIPAGSSNASFYYKDTQSNNALITVSDQSTLDNPDIGLVNATQTQTINWGNVQKLQFINSNSSIASGDIKQLQLRLLNASNGVVPTTQELTVFFSTSSNGLFSLSNNFDSVNLIDAYTISANQNGVDVYYKDTVASNVTVTASDVSRPAETPDTGLINAVQTFTVQPASLQRLVFITTPQNLAVGQTSNLMSVQARDIYGNITSVQNATPFYLYTTSPTGNFSLSTDFNVANQITQVTLNPGNSTISFYYRDLTYVAPNSQPQIKVSNQFPNPQVEDAILDAVQMQTITAGNISKMSFSPSANLGNLIAGNPLPLTVLFQNQYDVEIPLTTTKTIYLFSSLSGAQFASWNGSACGSFGINTLELSASVSRFTYCYKSSSSGSSTLTVSDTNVASPDTAWTNAIGTISIDAGDITQIAFVNNQTQNIIARHPSQELKIETRNVYGNATSVSTNRTIFLRSTSSTGEFAQSQGGPWGINFVAIPAGQSSISIYYRDTTVTSSPLTITAADSLPLVPDINWTNGTLQINITSQVVNNFLVTNISDPQIQGNSSSVVVMARDSENYIVDWYTGTISFSSSDTNAVLPQAYTFTSADKGIKTFVNGIAFSTTGEHYVRATDTNGITGQQSNITVNNNPAGPTTQVRFKDATSPTTVQKDKASVPFTIQIRDANGQGSNAGVGGFAVRLNSSSGTGEYSLSPNGPWTTNGVFTIPQNFNAVNIYYKDSTAGNFTLTASDWLGNQDDSGISNDTLSVIVNTLNINVSTDLEVNNNSHIYVDSPIIFAKNDTGTFTAKSTFQISTTDALAGTPKLSNLIINWKNPQGTTIQTESINNTASHVFTVPQFSGTASSTNYTLEIIGASTDGNFNVTSNTNIPVSGWTIKVDYNPNNVNLGQPLQFTIETRNNGTLADPVSASVNFKDNNGSDVSGTGRIKYLNELTKTETGKYSGSLNSSGLTIGDPYYLYARVYENTTTLAEDNNNDIFFENNPTVAPKNLKIEKVKTSIPPSAETYDLKFSWDISNYANTYNLYRSTNKTNTLFADACSINDISANHRYGEVGAVSPFCETTIQQNVNVDDETSWVEMASINNPTNTYTIPWSTIQSILTDSNYFYILRAENEAGESAYSTMVYSTKNTYTYNSVLANTNWISIPYNSVYKKASDIVNDIEGSTGNNSNKKINTVTLWKAGTQDVESYKYNSVLGKWVGTDFTINSGDGISLILSGQTSSFDWTVVGSDTVTQKTFNLNSGISNYNWMSIPYSTKFLTASEVVTNIEGSTGSGTNQKINRISIWNPTTQSINSYSYNNSLNSWTGTDFVLNPGAAVRIDLSGGNQNVTWTPYLVINPNQ